MNTLSVIPENLASSVHFRRAIEGHQPDVLTDIYQEDVNIAIWQRSLTNNIIEAASAILLNNPVLKASLVVSPQEADASLNKVLGSSSSAALLSEDIAQLVNMFCCLFDLKRAGLRLTTLDRAMCPRFHVDKVPCRLVTTYQGIATQWLPHHLADRNQLGAGNIGKPDEQTGIFQDLHDIRRLKQGDVALMKGELWHGNEGAGLIHRSPPISAGEHRLLLTLDFIND